MLLSSVMNDDSSLFCSTAGDLQGTSKLFSAKTAM